MKTPKNKSQNKVKTTVISGVLVTIIGAGITYVAPAVASIIQDIFFPPVTPLKWQVLHIIDKHTGKGIEGVNIEMAPNNAPPSSKKTDRSGYATIPIDPDNSAFKINIEKEKYKSLTKDVLIGKSSPLTTQEIQLEKIKIIRDPIVEEDGTDDKGRKASFTFKLILHDYAWEYSKVDKLKNTLNNTVVDAESEILKELNQSGKTKYIENAIHLIAVGMSSCEGDRKTEETRAEQRSTVIQHALSSLSNQPQNDIYKLSLGQFQKSDCPSQSQSQTVNQRKLLIVGVTAKEEGTQLEEALEDAMVKAAKHEKLLQSALSDYLAGSNGNISPLGTSTLSRYSRPKLKLTL
jgi:hypothetical protein